MTDLLYGEAEIEQRRINSRMMVVTRSIHLYSDVQRADDIIVILPAEAGEKYFTFEEKVRLVNPRIVAEGYKIGTRGFTDSTEVKERTYDLKCKEQGCMIQVSIPASVPLKEFGYNAEDIILMNGKSANTQGNLQSQNKKADS